MGSLDAGCAFGKALLYRSTGFVKCPGKPNVALISSCSSESFLVKSCFQKVVLSSRRVAATPFHAESSSSPVFLPLEAFCAILY